LIVSAVSDEKRELMTAVQSIEGVAEPIQSFSAAWIATVKERLLRPVQQRFDEGTGT